MPGPREGVRTADRGGTIGSVSSKRTAWVNHPENRAMIKAHHDERHALLATSPEVYEAGWATSSSAWVKVRLELVAPTRSSSSSRKGGG